MTYAEMTEALAEARRTMNICDSVAGDIAPLLVGRLRRLNSTHTLRRLKAELAQFNAQTGKWKP